MKKGRYILNEWMRRYVTDGYMDFYRNNIVRFMLLAIALLQMIAFGLLTFFVRSAQSIVIVHYNVYFGVDIVGEWAQVFMVPLVTFVFVIVNVFLAQWFYSQKERIASYVLLLTSLLISLGSVVACSGIALINY